MNEASKLLLEHLGQNYGHELRRVRELIQQGADVNTVNEEGNTPLLLVLRSNADDEIREYLCKKGADLHHRNHLGQTVLMLAVLRPWINDFSSSLIREEVEVDTVDNDGNSAVHYAYGNKDILALLIKRGTLLKQLNKKSQTLLHVPLLILDSIRSDGEPWYYGFGNLLTAYDYKIGLDNKTLRWLITQGVDPNARDAEGYSPLHAVSKINYKNPQQAAQALIESGADPAVLDATGTPLSVFHLYNGDQNLGMWFAEKGSHRFDAIIAGDLERVKKEFIPGLVIPPLRWGLTPLHIAVLVGASQEIFAHLVNATPDLNVPDEHGNSALALAICNKRPGMALALIKAGASTAIQGAGGSAYSVKDLVLMANVDLLSAMIKDKQPDELNELYGPYTRQFTAHSTSLTCLRLLIDKGLSPSAVDVDGMIYANYIDSWQYSLNDSIVLLLDQISLLIEQGAAPHLKPKTQECLVFLLKKNKHNIPNAVERLLIQCLVRGMSCKWSQDDSLLHHAIDKKNSALVEAILATGEEHIYRARVRNTRTPLRIAVEAQDQNVVGLLLSAGNKVVNEQILDESIQQCRSEKIMAMLLDYKATSSVSCHGQDPVTLLNTAEDAAKRGMTEILERLIEKGVSLNSSNNGKPIFHTLIIEQSSIKNLDWAIKHGADLKQSDSEGRILLHHLVSTWRDFNTDVFKRLLKLGLDINSKDAKGCTPFHLCIGRKDVWEKVVQCGIAYGGDLTLADASGKTLLHKSAMDWRCDPEFMQVLINAGISPQIRDDKGNTALAYVSDDLRNETTKKLKLLIEAGLHPDDAGDKRYLNAALTADDIPFAIWLLENQAQVSNCDLANKKVLAALSKITRSRHELIASQLDSLNDEQRHLLEPYLNKSANTPTEARFNELPELLREGGWPILLPSRAPIVTGKVVLPQREARALWRDGEQKQILSSRRVKHDADSDKKFEDAIGRFEKKPGTIKLGSLIQASDDLFIKYWNESSVALNQYVQVAGGGWWASKVIIGFRAEDLRYLLARYGLSVLPGILSLSSKKPGPVMKALANVDAPSCALQVAKFMTGSTSRLARRWLMAYPESAIHGLTPPAVGKPGKDRDAAEAALRYLASHGHRDAIETLAVQVGAEVTASISEILSVDPRTDYMPKKFPVLPSFWDAGIHPRPLLRNGSKALPLSAIEILLRMMSISTYDARTPALDDVIDACEPVSLADFAWSVFDEWRIKGDSASNWMFQALAYLGDDRYAKKLTPIIRDWPASNGQAKALMGLDILAEMGTDVAMAQIQSIARKNKYKPIVARADEMLTAIAEARELTAEQFEDRLVPTLGLDENGALVLDYGKRRFTGGVDETLKPRLIDETGATLKELPKPGKDDDKALTKQASDEWAEFKTELKPVASIQLLRLENAMIDARRWTGDEFLSLVAVHHLLQQPARSLVWGLFNEKGKLLKSFRIRPEGGAQDVKGKPVEVEATALVGIPHSITLGEEVAAWKKVFADAKQGQAFAQLVRKTYRRQDDAEMDLFGLQGATIHSKALKGLKSQGWEMMLSGIADLIDGYYRSFSGGDVEVRIEPGVFIRDLGNNAEEVTLEISLPKTFSEIEFSELIRELQTLKK